MTRTIIDSQDLERAITSLDRASEADDDARQAAERLRHVLHRATGPQLLTTREAADTLGVRSVNTIKHWVRTGYLRGVQRKERLLIPLQEIERIQQDDQVRMLRTAAQLEDEIAELGLDRPLTQEELDALSHARPGQLPWTEQRTARSTA